MIKLLLTSQTYQGHVEIIYGTKNELLKIDFALAVIEDYPKQVMLNRIPVQFASLKQFQDGFKSKYLKVAQEKLELDFEKDFWNPYGKKLNKKRVESIWNKLSKANQALAATGLASYERHLSKETWKNKADPETYLKKQYYLNEWN